MDTTPVQKAGQIAMLPKINATAPEVVKRLFNFPSSDIKEFQKAV